MLHGRTHTHTHTHTKFEWGQWREPLQKLNCKEKCDNTENGQERQLKVQINN